MPTHDKTARTFKLHPEHVLAAKGERIGKVKADRAEAHAAKHLSGPKTAVRPGVKLAKAIRKAASK